MNKYDRTPRGYLVSQMPPSLENNVNYNLELCKEIKQNKINMS